MADPNAGVLVILAIAAMGVYGTALGGWASQNKYGLLGSMRATAQMISYELAMAMSLLGVILMTGSVSMYDIVDAQRNMINLFPQFLGFLVFYIASLAEAGWTPFDLPESETELVAGYHTDYGGMRFGLFFLTELTHAVNSAVLTTTFFLGGYNPWFGAHDDPGLRLVPAEGRPDGLRPLLDQVHLPALPVRPADGLRLEGAAPGGGPEPGGHGHLRRPVGVTRGLRGGVLQ